MEKSENEKYNESLSDKICCISDDPIRKDDLTEALQPNGTYICAECRRD